MMHARTLGLLVMLAIAAACRFGRAEDVEPVAFAADDIRRLRLAAAYMAANEFQPGVFSHHEGSSHDCQNSNALGVQAVVRAYHALEKLGQKPPKQWLDAARRGMRHYIEGQEAIGCWPYVFARIGRQAFHPRNIPDQGTAPTGNRPGPGACCTGRVSPGCPPATKSGPVCSREALRI